MGKLTKIAIAIITAAIMTGAIYPETAMVTKLNRKKDIVTVETATGNRFEFYGCEDWERGDLCSMLMYSKGTKKVRDDVILDVRYSAKFRG